MFRRVVRRFRIQPARRYNAITGHLPLAILQRALVRRYALLFIVVLIVLLIGLLNPVFALDTGGTTDSSGDDSCWQNSAIVADAECSGDQLCAEALGTLYALAANCGAGTDWNGQCPSGTTACNGSGDGASRTCCSAGRHCETHGANAWCAPDNAQNCANNPPRTKYCPGGILNGDDGACCLPSEECDTIAMSSGVCKVTDNCAARGGTACGSYDCCQANQSCISVSGYKKCSANSCPQGQTLCGGSFSICCPAGTCSGSSSGIPSCIPTPTPTPPKTPTSTATATPTSQPSPSPSSRPSTKPAQILPATAKGHFDLSM